MFAWIAGCDKPADDLVLYTSIDAPVAEAVIAEFTRSTGIAVRIVGDTEATRSVGIASRLRAEKASPLADVWWGNEVFHTVALADEELFVPLDETLVAGISPTFVDPNRRWAGAGVRLRVVAASSKFEGETISLQTLLDPKFNGRITLARPTAGTTGGHVAALYTVWGRDKADAFFRALRENGVTLSGSNSEVVRNIAAGHFDLGLTDNDDVANAPADSGVRMIVPDLDELGTLGIPTTVALVRKRDISAGAKRLVAFLLSESSERQLIELNFAAASVREGSDVKTMPVDFAEVAANLSESVRRATAILEVREP